MLNLYWFHIIKINVYVVLSKTRNFDILSSKINKKENFQDKCQFCFFHFYISVLICMSYTAAMWSILKLVIVQSGKLAGPYFLENVADNSMDIGGCKFFFNGTIVHFNVNKDVTAQFVVKYLLNLCWFHIIKINVYIVLLKLRPVSFNVFDEEVFGPLTKKPT